MKKPGEPTSATAAPLVRAAVVLVRGPTLFRTLLSNLLPYRPNLNARVFSPREDAPAWEQDPPPRDLAKKKEPKQMPRGWLDLLTWESRRLELVREDGRVVGFVRAVHKGLDDGAPRDPMVVYRQHEKRGWYSVGLDPDRMFWRDANALFEPLDDRASTQRPAAVDFLCEEEVIDELGPLAELVLDVLGLSAEKSRLDLIRAEHLRGLARVFADGAAAREVQGALDNAESAVRALGKGLWVYATVALAPADRDPDRKDVSALVDSFGAKREAWSALGQRFDQLLRDLGERDYEAARARFANACVDVVRLRFEASTAAADNTGRWLKAQARGRAALDGALRPLTPSLSVQNAPNPAQEAV